MPQTVPLPAYDALYAFGDSLSDAGNVSISTSITPDPIPVSPPYSRAQYGSIGAAVFSNGPTWVQNLSLSLGLGALRPSLVGGTDYAFGGAETGATPRNASNAGVRALSLPAQLRTFQAAVPNPSADALYTVSVGANDLLGILAAPGLTAQQQAANVDAAVVNAAAFVSQLVAGGAKTVVVVNVPDLGKLPRVASGAINAGAPPATLAAQASQLSSAYNTALAARLASVGSAAIRIVDAYGLIDDAAANPAIYGLANVTAPVWTGTLSSAGSGTLASADAAVQNQYLFFDQIHPTETGHQALAAAAVQQLTGVPTLLAQDATTGQPLRAVSRPYTGPVAALQQQYVNVTPDNLNILATTPNWFIHAGGGNDAIAVAGGVNVLDGGAGSNFLTGGDGPDTFFVDDRQPASAIWSTIVGFAPGDAATVFGLTPRDFALSWVDGQGAAGAAGLTLHATAPGVPTASLTLAGFTTADLANGRLGVSYGATTEQGGALGSPYLYIQANA